MSLFSKPKVIIWPKDKSVEIYLNKKENNFFSLDISLWTNQSEKDIESLASFLRQNKVSSLSVLIPDNIVITKSFVYDTKIDSIDVKEVIGLSSAAVDFKIDSEYINYSLIQGEDKTIINTLIYNKSKFETLKNNLNLLGVQINSYTPVSAAISNVISKIFLSEFFLIYPLNNNEDTLLLTQNNQVYLTANFKKSNLDIQKTVNYAQFYFSNPVKKIYYPESEDTEIITSTEMEKTPYNESQIAQNFNYPSNLPLPVIGIISDIIKAPKDNNSNQKPKMNNKKNLLPIISVAVFSFIVVSFLVYFFSNRNKQNEIVDSNQTNDNFVSESQPTVTQTPTPTIAEIKKDIKIQVLNGTDINGQAATLKAKLVSLGFEDVSTGNTSENVTKNLVQVKSATTSAYFKSVLADYFPAEYTSDLKTTSTYDIVFTIGTDLSASSPTKTATATPSVKVTPTIKVTATPTVD
jgi:hypothetical protein